MEMILKATYLALGALHLYPATAVLGRSVVERQYGIVVKDADLELLLRHRAVLFGLLGAALVLAAFRPAWRTPAAAAVFVSMLTYVFLALPVEAHNGALQRVFWADVAGSALLAGVLLAARFASQARAPG